MSNTSIRDDGYRVGSDNAFRRPATVVDFPEPVVPTTAECLVTSLELPSVFRLPTHRHYAANFFSC